MKKRKFLQIIAGTAWCVCNEKMEQSSTWTRRSFSPIEGGTEGNTPPAFGPEILISDTPVCVVTREINA